MGIDVDDDDLDFGEEDASPTRSNGHITGSNSTPLGSQNFAYRRQQVIAAKGYDRYLAELMGRAGEALQVLRTERSIQHLGAVEIIGELELELGIVGKENSTLRMQVESKSMNGNPLAADVQTTQVLEQYEEDIQHLQARVSQLESSLIAREQAIQQLQSQLAAAQAEASDARTAAVAAVRSSVPRPDTAQLAELDSLRKQVEGLQAQLSGKEHANITLQAQLRGASAATSGVALGVGALDKQHATQVEQLQAVIANKEAQLAAALAEVKDLKAGGARGSGERSAEAAAALSDAVRQRDEAHQHVTMLEARVADLQAETSRKEGEFAAKLREITAASEHQQAAMLQKHMWELTEAHTRKVEELEAELRQKAQTIALLQAQKADAVKAEAAASAKVKQAKESAAGEFRAQLAALYKYVDELNAFRDSIQGELIAMTNDMFNETVQTKMVRMMRDREIGAIRKAKAEMRAEVDAAEARAKDAEEGAEAAREQCEHALRIKDLESAGAIKHYKDKWRAEFDKRKKLHNMVLDLKGSIRVLCRVRPLLEKERFNLETGPDGQPVQPVKCTTEELIKVTSDKGDKEFEFDRVFASSEGQETVFDEVCALVTSVLDGYNVCIMAYGQTGSGKTHTMEGPDSDPGVNSRALQELFRLAEERGDEWEYRFSASVLEIYNEQIYDLLAGGRDQDAEKLDVKQGPDGMYVPGLRVEEVAALSDVAAVIHKGKQNRSTFATNMNEHSSRSHLVLSVYTVATARMGGAVMRGKLHLIDLAGSERIGRTGAQGDRLKEAQAINKSLSSLGDVIQALQQRNAHIPYRNSKLTRLLEDSLGASSKCVMVVNVSPAAENVPETKCSLEFASRARKVELGRARQNIADGTESGTATPKTGRNTPAAGTPGMLSRSTSGRDLPTSARSKLGK